jgi:1-aminocyclopropane-1-carboxylate synthase
MKKFLSDRGKSLVKDMPPLMHAHFSTVDKLYDPEHNSDGYINMGTAETHLVNDEVTDIIMKIQRDMTVKPSYIHYDYSYGIPEFRTAIAEYWQNLIFENNTERLIKAENIVVGCGCSIALEMLATMLGDPGDAILIPAPYYTGFEDDIYARAGLLPIPVQCGPKLNKSSFQEVIEEQKKKNIRVRAVLLSSPNNPVGTVYKPEELQNVIDFCMENNLDIISDEIYAQTIHDPNTKWVSMYSLVPDEYLDRVHVTSSFSKDFSLSGFRTGFVISFNKDMLKGMHVLSYYSNVSNHTQAVLTDLLKSPELPGIIQTSKEQLSNNQKMMSSMLKEIGIHSEPAQGGIFLFANFGKFMKEKSFEEEFVLWERIFGELRINISPGQIFKAEEPGWFRVCYAHPTPVIEEACRRLRTL